MSDPIGPGNFKRKKRSADDSIFQVHRQQAHDELDDSRLNEIPAKEKNAIRIHEARAITSYLHDNDDRTRSFAQHDDSANAARDRLAEFDVKIDPETADTGLMSSKLSRSGDRADRASRRRTKK